MLRRVLLATFAVLLLLDTGCYACRRLFGLDRRCDSPPAPPPGYNAPYNMAPGAVVVGPNQYAPPPACIK